MDPGNRSTSNITLTLSELIGNNKLTAEKSMDLNGDGVVNKFDSMLMMRHMLGTFPGESLKKGIPGTVDLAAVRTKINQIFSETFSLGGGLKLDVDGDNRISAFSDGLLIMHYVNQQVPQASPRDPWAPPAIIPGVLIPDLISGMQQHLHDLVGF